MKISIKDLSITDLYMIYRLYIYLYLYYDKKINY